MEKCTSINDEAMNEESLESFDNINDEENNNIKKQIIKMNGLYKTGFILLMVCIPMFLSSIAVAYLYNKWLSVVFSGGGAFLAFLGIIFVMKSKVKRIEYKTEIEKEADEEV